MIGEGSQVQQAQTKDATRTTSVDNQCESTQERYGPWMTISKPKRQPRGPATQKKTNTPKHNRFEALTEPGAIATSHIAQTGKGKSSNGKAHSEADSNTTQDPMKGNMTLAQT
ncbi:hypothetical protein LOK49_LG13G01932 [Camellia lanceoleosa]|uniref:Uncharacterized protein n=1 Tax=Camellia lanceoleosa TaxID=1840588 RepID=A0ACC0FQA2_9ERIC|nr:hypothetical protein LOK49_LG13G01932 [Camellia lanceoleosa]